MCKETNDQCDIGSCNHEIMWRPSEWESPSLQTKKGMPNVLQNQSKRSTEKVSEMIASWTVTKVEIRLVTDHPWCCTWLFGQSSAGCWCQQVRQAYCWLGEFVWLFVVFKFITPRQRIGPGGKRWKQYWIRCWRFQESILRHCYTTRRSKVKCTLVQALKLCTGRTAHRGSRGIALLYHDHSTRRGWGVSVTPRPLSTPGKDTVPIVQEVGWATGPVWTGAENLASTGIRSPARRNNGRNAWCWRSLH